LRGLIESHDARCLGDVQAFQPYAVGVAEPHAAGGFGDEAAVGELDD